MAVESSHSNYRCAATPPGGNYRTSAHVGNAHWVLIAVVGFAILLCFVSLSVLLVLVQRPPEELWPQLSGFGGGI